MALATQCPHCNTTFRVASDQLKLRGGIVRCGACQEVFDGNAALIDHEDPGTAAPPSARLDAVPESTAPASHSDAFDAEVAALDARQAPDSGEPIYTLDFDTTFDPFGILPAVAQPAAEPAPEQLPPPETAPAAVTDSPLDQAIEAHSLPDQDLAAALAPSAMQGADQLGPMLMRASAASLPAAPIARVAEPLPAARKQRKRAPPAAPVAPPEPVAPDHDEPEFVKQSRQQEQAGRKHRIVLLAGSALLVLALAVQGVATFRNVLAARYPQSKPALVSACALFGCRIELPAQIDTLGIETGELQTLGARAFSFTTLLRNQGELAQAWPHIELALTDGNDKPLLRRVFAPAQYLPQGTPVAKGFAPRSEQAVKLYFELDQLKASGYHIAVFYP